MCFSSHNQSVGIRGKGHAAELKIVWGLGPGVEYELKYLNRSLKVLLAEELGKAYCFPLLYVCSELVGTLE